MTQTGAMSPETTVFVLTVLLAFLHVLIQIVIQTSIYGTSVLVGARDNLQPSDNVYLGRARRANENMKETLPWALGLLLLVQMEGAYAGTAGNTAALGAWIYFWARVAYLPLYLLGVPWLRTLAWVVALVGLGMLLTPIVT